MYEVEWEQVIICRHQLVWVEVQLAMKSNEWNGQSCRSIGISDRGCRRSFVVHVFFVPDGVTFTYPQQPVPDWRWHWHTLLQRAQCTHSQYKLSHWCSTWHKLKASSLRREVMSGGMESPSHRLEWREGDVTKVTVHLPPTATHLLSECTLLPHALLLASSDVPDKVNRDGVYQVKREKMRIKCTKKRRWRWVLPIREDEEEDVDCSVYVMDYIRTVY